MFLLTMNYNPDHETTVVAVSEDLDRLKEAAVDNERQFDSAAGSEDEQEITAEWVQQEEGSFGGSVVYYEWSVDDDSAYEIRPIEVV